MRRMIHILCAAFAFCALLLTASCERRPLMDSELMTEIRVEVDVKAISNVTCDIYNEKIQKPEISPEVMHALFFNRKNGQLSAESFISEKEMNAEGEQVFTGHIAIMPGEYQMLIYNFGTESTIVKNHYTWEDAEAYTNKVSEKTLSSYRTRNDAANEIVVYEPDHLVVASKEKEYIPYHTDIHTISANAVSVVESYYLQIKVDGLEYVSSAQAFLSGMVSGNKISQNERITDPENTVYFTLTKSDDKGVPVICNIFNTFGRIDNSYNRLEVTFDIKTIDGRTVQKSFDISDLFLTEDCIKHHWLLLDEVIKIDPPETPSTGGGFAPEVEDWEHENHDVIL